MMRQSYLKISLGSNVNANWMILDNVLVCFLRSKSFLNLAVHYYWNSQNSFGNAIIASLLGYLGHFEFSGCSEASLPLLCFGRWQILVFVMLYIGAITVLFKLYVRLYQIFYLPSRLIMCWFNLILWSISRSVTVLSWMSRYQDWMCCLLRKLISNAKHCQYACLLERHCPAIHFKASMQPLKCKVCKFHIPLSFVFVLLFVWLHFLDEFYVVFTQEHFFCRKPFYAIWKVLWLKTRSRVLLRAVVRFLGHVRMQLSNYSLLQILLLI